MKKILALVLCVMQILCTAVFADGGAVVIGDIGSESLFTGSASEHFLLLSSGGVVSAWGKNDSGQCAAEKSEYINAPNYIEFETKITKVSAGADFSIALDENGDAWGWGSNKNHQISTKDIECFEKPVKIESEIKDIAAGNNFALFLKNDGSIYVSGGEDKLSKADYTKGEAACRVAVRKNNIIVLTQSGKVYNLKYNETEAKAVEFDENKTILSVSAGAEHGVILAYSEDEAYVYTFGSNKNHQLGIDDDNLPETNEAQLVLTLSYDGQTNINVVTGDYSTFVDVYETVSSMSEIFEYCFGSGCYYMSESVDDYGLYKRGFEEDVIKEPQRRDTAHLMIAAGNKKSIAYRFDDAIEVFGDGENPKVTHILQSEQAQTMYPYQYENLKYQDVTVNFIKIDNTNFDKYADDYLYWQYVDAHRFKVKIKDFISGLGMSEFDEAIGLVRLDKDVTNEPRKVGAVLQKIWNFENGGEFYKAADIEAEHGKEDGTRIEISAFVREFRREKELNIPENTEVFFSNPEKITENTKLGLYIYGLPKGCSAETESINANKIVLKLNGNSNCDMDYDTKLNICYVYNTKNPQSTGYVGDFDLENISAGKKTLDGFVIKSAENTPEVLLASAELVSGKENAKKIMLTLTGGEFFQGLAAAEWEIKGSPYLSVSEINRIDDTHAEAVISGNSADKYSDYEITVICGASQYSDSRYYDETTGSFTNAALSSNAIKISKQKKTNGGFNGSGISGKKTYSVKFETNGGNAMQIQKVTEGEALGEVKAALKDGYVFDGWYYDKELTKPYDPGAKINVGITLYASWKTDHARQIILTVGETKAQVFGKIVQNDVAPLISENRTMMPSRFAAESLGAKVLWDGETKTVTIKGKNVSSNEEVTIIIVIGDNKAYVNGKETELETPAFIQNDRTYTPLRFICENLGASVTWNKDTRQITITK